MLEPGQLQWTLLSTTVVHSGPTKERNSDHFYIELVERVEVLKGLRRR